MTRREMLMERYEDALFALLMDEVAEAEGEAALELNEQLRSDPAADVPLLTRKRCERVIRGALTREGVKRARRVTGRVLQKVCVVATLCAVVFGTAFVTVEEFRVATLNALIEAFDDRTEITFPQTQDGPEGAAPRETGEETGGYVIQQYGIGLEWVPEGYEVETGDSIPGKHKLVLRNDVESQIRISLEDFHSGLTDTFDTEECEEKPVTIQKIAGTLYVKTDVGLQQLFGNMSQIWSKQKVIWVDDELQMVCYVSATNLMEEEILRLAEGTHFVG